MYMKRLSVLCCLIFLLVLSGCRREVPEEPENSVGLDASENPRLSYVLPSPEMVGRLSKVAK